MTIEEKAKAYDEAIEKVKKSYGNRIAEDIFPELREDDNERIKKNCIRFLELQRQHYAETFEIEECIAWLANQGKNSTNKTKPRFNVGDWVIFIKDKRIFRVEEKENYEYTLRYILGGSICLPFSNEELIREWTIQDAKDGDIICYKDEISLYENDIKYLTKPEPTFGGFTYYCCYDGKRFITNNFYLLIEQDKIDIHPATKEQRDALIKAINNAGYEWNAEKKELKKK